MISAEQLFARPRDVAEEDDEYAVENLPGGTYYPITKLLRRNVKGNSFKVRWSGFQKEADEWRSRTALMKDCPQLVREFEKACRFDPMAPPVESPGWKEARAEELAIQEGMVPCRGGKEITDHRSEVVAMEAQGMNWESLLQHGVGVDPEDAHRTPPQFHMLRADFWRTPPPKANTTKVPRQHTREPVDGKRSRRAPDQLGMSTVCAHNYDLFMECDYACTENAPLARQVSTVNMLKYHDGRQWGLHAAQARKKGDFISPYVGDVLSGQEGLRRKQAKIATSPSYLLQLGSCYIDAEHYGNAT